MATTPCVLGLLVAVTFLLTGCKEQFSLIEDVPLSKMEVPVVETASVGAVTQDGAEIIARIARNGGGRVNASGFCWSEQENPDTSDFRTNDGFADGRYRSIIDGLKINTRYFVRAYAVNAKGVGYGEQLAFTTLPPLAELSTKPADAITQTSALVGATITAHLQTITEIGVCWSALGVPTINDAKAVSSPITADFNSELTGLEGGTVYAARAYAINSSGVAYGNTVYFTTDAPTFTDIDGNVYHAIRVGNQTWSMENLQTTRYRNGDPIYHVENYQEWGALPTGGYANYQGNALLAQTYGRYYNYFAVIDPRNIAPVGWRVPTDDDWRELTTFLGGEAVAGGKLKSTGTVHWNAPNAGATNESGFSALGAGILLFSPGGEMHARTIFWTNTEFNPEVGLVRILENNSEAAVYSGAPKTAGFSVRLIKVN